LRPPLESSVRARSARLPGVVAFGRMGHYKTRSKLGTRRSGSPFRALVRALLAPGSALDGGFCRRPRDGSERAGGMSRVAKGADCKSAGVRLRRFESYFPHHASEDEEITAHRSPRV